MRFAAPLTVAGLEIFLDARTERLAYLTTDQVTATVTNTANQPLAAATLRLRVIRPGSDPAPTGDWRAPLADGGSSNQVAADYQLPFSLDWSSPLSGFAPAIPLSVGGLVMLVAAAAQTLQARDGNNDQLVSETPYDGFGFLLSNSPTFGRNPGA